MSERIFVYVIVYQYDVFLSRADDNGSEFVSVKYLSLKKYTFLFCADYI
jgi:hypothetical protein